MAAGRNATFNNSAGATVGLTGLNAITINGIDSSTFNNSSNQGNDNGSDCTANSAGGVCVTGVAAILGGPLGAPLEFNNQGGLVSMINGTSNVATDAAAFLGLTGLAYPQYNTGIGDVTVIGGNFNATGNSQVGVDVFVKGPNDSSSDLMIVTGATSGRTSIIVNDVSNRAGGYNTSGIPIVAVTSGNTSADHFRLDPNSTNYDSKFGGVLDKGLFFYHLTTKNDPYYNQVHGFANNGVDHVLVSAPDSELFELSKAVAGAQNIWHETTGAWLERQAPVGPATNRLHPHARRNGAARWG